MSELERLARAALLVAGGGSIDDPADGEYAKSVVRAILQELRDPTEKLRAEGIYAIDQLYDGIRDNATDAMVTASWQAIIDYILSEGNT